MCMGGVKSGVSVLFKSLGIGTVYSMAYQLSRGMYISPQNMVHCYRETTIAEAGHHARPVPRNVTACMRNESIFSRNAT